ncbi:MAG: TetR/AcrR family transcriptional regulator [Desulfatitalea sp.]|nr:TetR/AcrR family transcriptional regulator [Desulfatitalea sp.]NNK02493.1 TetR/AcrR family transcriptional regulator [Desulfatitalea sp.]
MKQNERIDKNFEQAIFAAAEDLFIERGYDLTSTVAIAKRAGCNQALVHYYYRTKDNLFQAIFAQKTMQFLKGIMAVDEQDLPFEDAIKHIIEAQFDSILANIRIGSFLLEELVRNPDRWDSLKSLIFTKVPLDVIKNLEMRLEKEIAEGRVRNMTFLDLAMTIIWANSMFLIRPLIAKIIDIPETQQDEFFRRRCKENIEIVLRSLKP